MALAMVIDRDKVLARVKAERRQYQRVRVELSGRLFSPTEGREAPCRIVGLSPGDAHVTSDFVPQNDEQVVLYIDGFGRVEGTVARSATDFFSVKFQCSALKREKIVELLTLYVNRDLVDETVVRRHDRAPTSGLARFTRANGDSFSCEVLDLSLSGLSLKTEIRPPIGEIVLIGPTAGRVVRYHENGIAIEFTSPPGERAARAPAPNPFLLLRSNG
jgi:hypothetical protein